MLSSHVRRVLTGLHTKRFVLFCFCFRLLFFFFFAFFRREARRGVWCSSFAFALLKNANRNKITGDMQAKKGIFAWPWKMALVSIRYLFYQPITMDKKIKTWTLFPPKKTLIWRRHCSIGQSCCSMTSKRSIGWFLESFWAWNFFTRRSVRLTSTNKPKVTRVCIRLINQSHRSISVCLLLLFCLRVFISRSYENRNRFITMSSVTLLLIYTLSFLCPKNLHKHCL